MTPQPNDLSHIDRVLRLLHTGNQLVTHTQEQARKGGAIGSFLPFLIPNIPLKQMQSNFQELAALMQVIRLNLEHIKEELEKG